MQDTGFQSSTAHKELSHSNSHVKQWKPVLPWVSLEMATVPANTLITQPCDYIKL